MDMLSGIEPDPVWLNDSGIRRIFVEDLFGYFKYELSIPLGGGLDSARILLLYGDNGSGKTTILRLLFFLLSHIDKAGHKTQVKKIRFRTFEVNFSSGYTVVAARNHSSEEAYRLSIFLSGRLVASTMYFEEEPQLEELENLPRNQLVAHVNRKQEQEQSHAAVLDALKGLDLRMIYVTDKRKTFTTLSELRQSLRQQNRRHRQRELFPSGDEDSDRDGEPITLNAAVNHISSWATRKAFDGTTKGEADVNTVYASIIEKLAHPKAATALEEPDVSGLINQLQDLSKRSLGFVRFGLAKPLDLSRIIKTLQEVEEPAKQTAVDILNPYVTSLQARFAALETIRVQLEQFVEIVGSFYTNKRVSLDIRRGLLIQAPNEQFLSPSMLSSGEAQLLFVLASTLMAKERSSLFMIDEPEISMNVNWQRRLIQALLDMTQGTKIQFLMATHSIELLTRYRNFVTVLENLN